MWAIAIENAVGRMLNAFIVTDYRDARILRTCAREANYNNVQIIIYDFRRPRLFACPQSIINSLLYLQSIIGSNSLAYPIGRIDIPRHMLPQTNHPTALSVLHSDNPVVLNVLVDMVSFQHYLAISLVFT